METFTHKRTGKTFTIGGHAKIVGCDKYVPSSLDPDLSSSKYKIGSIVKITGVSSLKWPLIEGLRNSIDPDCLEPLPITAEEIKAEISKHQSEIAKHEKEIEQLKFQLSQLSAS